MTRNKADRIKVEGLHKLTWYASVRYKFTSQHQTLCGNLIASMLFYHILSLYSINILFMSNNFKDYNQVKYIFSLTVAREVLGG